MVATAHVGADQAAVGSRCGRFENDAAFAHHRNAVAEFEQFVEVFADQQHRAAFGAHLQDACVDFRDGREVQPEHRVRGDQHVDLARQLTRIRCDIQMPTTRAQLRRGNPDPSDIDSFYEAQGFGALLRRQAARLVTS